MENKEDQFLVEQNEDKKKTIPTSNQDSVGIKDTELKDEQAVVVYTASDGKVMANVFFADDTFWVTQKTMAELFGVKIPAISKHLKNIYVSGELSKKATISKMETVQIEGARQITRIIDVYNLDVTIAVGYRVNSIKATQFLIWATNTLREYIVKGFVLNDHIFLDISLFIDDSMLLTVPSASLIL